MVTISTQATENGTASQAQDEDGTEKPATNEPQSAKSKETATSGEKKASEISEKESSAKESPAKKAKAAGRGVKVAAKKTATKKADTKAAEDEDGSRETEGKGGQEGPKKPSTKRSGSKKAVPKKPGTKASAKKAAPKRSSASKSKADEETAEQDAADEQISESKAAAKPTKESKRVPSKKKFSTKRAEDGHAEGETGAAQSGGVDSDIDMDDLDRGSDELDDSADTEEADADADSGEEGEDSNDKDGAECPRGRNLTEDMIPTSKGIFTMKDSDESDEPTVHVHIAGAIANPVKDYLKQTGKVPLLSAEEEVELTRCVEAGLYAQHVLESGSLDKAKDRMYIHELKLISHDGQQAKSRLLRANLRLVVSLAKCYTGRGMLFLDFTQEGDLGLVHAVEKLDFTGSSKFSAYITQRIRQAITRAVADQARTIWIPIHMIEVINRLAWVQRRTLQDLDRESTTIKLAKELDMIEEKVIEVRKYGRGPVSLHTSLGEDGDSEFGDLVEDSETVVPANAVGFTLLQEQLRQVLDTLSEWETGMVVMYFGLTDGQTKTLDEIGKIYGVTCERIRQTESKTMSKLRRPPRSQVLRDYLD